MPVLETRDVSIRFGGLQALDQVNLRVNEGEIVGILGPNGAGKTTLFNCISGFYTPTSGTVHLFGDDITGERPEERARRGLGRTFQQVGLVRSFTVLENLIVAQHMSVDYGDAATIAGAPWALAGERGLRKRARILLDYLDLGHVADSSVNGLPYGTLKMVEVAAVLATDPQILILDEPLAGASPEEGAAFCERLAHWRRELSLSIVMIEHHVPLVLSTSDYVYVLNFGKLLAEGLPNDVRGDSAVAEAYMGEGATSLA